MKHLVFIIKASLQGLLLLSLSSCIITVPKERRACYKELKKFANENWKFSHNDSILIETRVLLDMAISKGDTNSRLNECTKGMTEKEIQRIFNKPHEIVIVDYNILKNVKRYYYYLWNCYPSVTKVKACNYYYFEFNNEGKCFSFGTGGVQKSH